MAMCDDNRDRDDDGRRIKDETVEYRERGIGCEMHAKQKERICEINQFAQWIYVFIYTFLACYANEFQINAVFKYEAMSKMHALKNNFMSYLLN